jgi:hypothetical protein
MPAGARGGVAPLRLPLSLRNAAPAVVAVNRVAGCVIQGSPSLPRLASFAGAAWCAAFGGCGRRLRLPRLR